MIRWAGERDIATPVTSTAQQLLMAYRNREWPVAKAMALRRNQFGGHPLHRADAEAEADE